MLEVELKIKINDLDLFHTKLDRLNARFVTILEHLDRYYNRPIGTGDFQKTDEALRLRASYEKDPKTGDLIKENHDFTYKGPKLDPTVKTRKEHVCRLQDPNEMDLILLSLGYPKVMTLKKNRKVYKLTYQDQEMECLIDQVDGLDGYYFEAEIMVSNEKEVPNAKKILLSLLNELGYTEKDCIVDSYLELVLNSSSN